jgi:hypothetical protein
VVHGKLLLFAAFLFKPEQEPFPARVIIFDLQIHDGADPGEAIVNSINQDLFKPLHGVFDLAIIDRFHTFVPGCLEYAIEGRRRVKEQLNKRKPDDEFAQIDLSFIRSNGEERVVCCPESKNSPATQNPTRPTKSEAELRAKAEAIQAAVRPVAEAGVMSTPVAEPGIPPKPSAKERHYRIHYGATGFSYETIFKDYLPRP